MKYCYQLAAGVLVVMSLSLASALAVQKPTTIIVTRREVVLDVVVTDKAGHVVNDLAESDFTVFEEGIQQTVLSFEAPAAHFLPMDRMIHSAANLEQQAPRAPVDIIVLDEMNTRFEDTAYARWAIGKYLRTQQGKLSHPTELLAVSEKQFQVLHEFTLDRNAILSAMQAHLTAYPWNLDQGTSGRDLIDRFALSLAALEQVAESTRGHAGHKNLIWIGRGFPSINTNTLPDRAKVGIVDAVRHALDMLTTARVTLNTIDPTSLTTLYQNISNPEGLTTFQDENGSDPFTADIRFTTLAPATGGRAYFSRNDVDRELDLSNQAGSNFYTIFYSPINHTDAVSAYRRIQVKVNRPGLTATTRNGYYGIDADGSAAAKRNQTIFDLSTALDSNLAYTDLEVKADKPLQGNDNFTLHIGSQHLDWQGTPDGERQAHVIIEMGNFGRKGQLLGRTLYRMTFRSNLSGTNQTTSYIFARIPEIQTAGTCRVRFVVRDDVNGHLGTAEIVMP